MLKARGVVGSTGRRVVIFGLSETNMRELLSGIPIVLDGDEVGVDAQVVLFAGGTDDDMARLLEGSVVPTTGR